MCFDIENIHLHMSGQIFKALNNMLLNIFSDYSFLLFKITQPPPDTPYFNLCLKRERKVALRLVCIYLMYFGRYCKMSPVLEALLLFGMAQCCRRPKKSITSPALP